jgi:hypothetical protein
MRNDGEKSLPGHRKWEEGIAFRMMAGQSEHGGRQCWGQNCSDGGSAAGVVGGSLGGGNVRAGKVRGRAFRDSI